MFRKSLAAIAALALLASTMPPAVTTAGEFKGKQKKQRMPVPAVKPTRAAVPRSQQTKPRYDQVWQPYWETTGGSSDKKDRPGSFTAEPRPKAAKTIKRLQR